MFFTFSWLKDYLQTDAPLSTITDTLTAIGLEVEGVTDPAATLTPFTVAKIISADPHPDADRLQICQVQTSASKDDVVGDISQIVCGAPNARAGIYVALAPIGAVIPTNGMKIKQSKIRGVESSGMLCSASELGVGEDGAGIIEVNATDADIGASYANVAGLDDPVIEIAITPNRGDCLGVYGIARDLAAAGLGTLRPLEKLLDGASLPSVDRLSMLKEKSVPSSVSVTLENKEACPYFIGRTISGLKNTSSPDWLARRLKAIGLRPISALVDITNYMTYAFGRPLHVYDVDQLEGNNLTVRLANKGEKVSALNDHSYELDADIAVVADASCPQAIGGVVGASQSGCTLTTQNVFLEVAYFTADAVTHAGRALDVQTDSRYRFERHVDPQFMQHAAQIATKMICDLCAVNDDSLKVSELVIAGNIPREERTILFSAEHVFSRVGVRVSDDKVQDYLQAIGCNFSDQGKDHKGDGTSVLLRVTPPSWRPDIMESEDLVEEIIRLHGYDTIEVTPLPPHPKGLKVTTPDIRVRARKARQSLIGLGYNEVITWSFIHHKHACLFGGGDHSPVVQNPIHSQWNTMRPSILPGLIDVAVKNKSRGEASLALCEVGPIFNGKTPDEQSTVIALLRTGATTLAHPLQSSRNTDWLDAKTDAIAALDAMGAPVDNLITSDQAPAWYHPGRSGSLKLGKQVLAVFGQLHPAILKDLECDQDIVGAEIYCDRLPPIKKKGTARPVLKRSEYQASTRDYAFLIPKDQPIEPLIKAIQSADRQMIDAVNLFDIFEGKGVPEGSRSIALSVRLQPKDATLTDDQLRSLSDAIIAAAGKHQAQLRG